MIIEFSMPVMGIFIVWIILNLLGVCFFKEKYQKYVTASIDICLTAIITYSIFMLIFKYAL